MSLLLLLCQGNTGYAEDILVLYSVVVHRWSQLYKALVKYRLYNWDHLELYKALVKYRLYNWDHLEFGHIQLRVNTCLRTCVLQGVPDGIG